MVYFINRSKSLLIRGQRFGAKVKLPASQAVFKSPLQRDLVFKIGMLKILTGCFLIAAVMVLAGCQEVSAPTSHDGPLTPSEALSSFELEPGFKIELLAGEPLINSPVDMEIDEYGRLYVVEMPGYPLDTSGTGRIKILTDKDGDGQMDASVVFADGLKFPNGILRWKKGVIVTDAPNVLYLEDRDGDGRSDHRDTLLTGFSLSNPHVNVNNPVYGLDNWIYLAHFGSIGTRKYDAQFGDKGTEIRFPGYSSLPRLPQNANGRTVRFRPDKQKLEMTSSRTQFGHTFDRWGRHILNHNQNHIYHEVMGANYLQRNRNLIVSDATQSISDHGNETEVFQITTNPDRQLFTPVGLTTSSSGITAYLGGIFPAPFNGNVVFVAESVSNLVHVDVLEDKGSSFTARRHRERREFLASRDSWSRPVNMYVGPDGALYVLDYYRRIIEHPEWMSDEAIAAGGLYDGHDMGRIYRITPEATRSADWTTGLKFGNEGPTEWVKYLANTNIWWRQNAQRLLVDKASDATVPLLVEMAKNVSSPEGRLHALWTLEGMGTLTSELIEGALRDTQAGIRENAIRLAELHLNNAPGLERALFSLKTDPDPKVRFQLLCTLGFIATPESARVREELLFRDLDDEWVQIAALSTPASQAPSLLESVLKRFKSGSASYRSLVRRLTSMITAGNDRNTTEKLLHNALASTSKSGWQSSILDGIADGLKGKKDESFLFKTASGRLANAFFAHRDPAVRESCLSLLKVVGLPDDSSKAQRIRQAALLGADPSMENERRIEALRFLALGDVTPYVTTLEGLIVPQEHVGVQAAALQALGGVPGTEVSRYLLRRWETLTPGIREIALETFMAEPERVSILLEALESRKITEASIGWKRSAQLMSHPLEELRIKARQLLQRRDGKEVIREYEKALHLSGNVSDGKLVYKNNCAICHQSPDGDGIAFGPNLGTVHNWRSKDLMANILDPNLSIAPGYDLWEIALRDGEKVQGMIMNETSSAIGLRTSPGVERTVNRQEIDAIRGLNMSLMPVLSEHLDQQQMADLLAYLQQMN